MTATPPSKRSRRVKWILSLLALGVSAMILGPSLADFAGYGSHGLTAFLVAWGEFVAVGSAIALYISVRRRWFG
jgi:hypothetical protein